MFKDKPLLLCITLSGFLAVTLGAFGAHGLKPYLDDYQRLIFEKGISYQFYHTIAALCAYLLYEMKNVKALRVASFIFISGIVFFSGSLYLLATQSLTHFPSTIAGPMTPIGGVLFIAGWASLAIAVFKNS